MTTFAKKIGHAEVLLYPCLRYYKGGNSSSHVCWLLELLRWFWQRNVISTGEYGEDYGYGKNSNGMFSIYVV